jgi:hypothetical protein
MTAYRLPIKMLCCIVFLHLKITLSGRKWYLTKGEYEDDLWSDNPKISVTELWLNPVEKLK